MVRDRIAVLTDLFLGAVWADDEFSEDEQVAVRALLGELLEVDPSALPDPVEARLRDFEPLSFDLASAAAEFANDPPMAKRRLLALVGRMVDADGVVEVQEEQYLRELAGHLGLEHEDYSNLSLAYSIEELRETFTRLRTPPPPMVDPDSRSSRPPPPPPPMVVETPRVPPNALPPRDGENDG